MHLKLILITIQLYNMSGKDTSMRIASIALAGIGIILLILLIYTYV